VICAVPHFRIFLTVLLRFVDRSFHSSHNS
jgi:hypothetical protein